MSREEICRRSLISGRVQGVFYRHCTREKAVELGLRGWVRNQPDGRVEAVVQGDRDQVEAILDWFWQGSPSSRVDGVQTEVQELEKFETFEVKR